jgi:hypothetical protein
MALKLNGNAVASAADGMSSSVCIILSVITANEHPQEATYIRVHVQGAAKRPPPFQTAVTNK